MEYIGYKFKMDPFGIQFSDKGDTSKLTLDSLSHKHGFEQGDKFVLYTDTGGMVTLKKVQDWDHK